MEIKEEIEQLKAKLTGDFFAMKKTMTTIKEEIEQLKGMLTGDIFKDGELMMEIYELKKQLNPEIETNPEADDDEDGCIFCGS
jgi:hypothetical protein